LEHRASNLVSIKKFKRYRNLKRPYAPVRTVATGYLMQPLKEDGNIIMKVGRY
jgi:hypothetical protein